MEISKNLLELAKEYAKTGNTLYVVGGAVRNMMLGLPVTDIDICGACEPNVMQGIVSSLGYKFQVVNATLGTCLITVSDSEQYEYSTFRTDEYSLGHTPVKVQFVQDIKVDARRRDFTIGAMYYNILTSEIIDFYDGIKDVQDGIIRTVETPEHVFSADGLRIMRMVRFACELGYTIQKHTFDVAKANMGKLNQISAERKLKELKLILYSDFRYGNSNNCVKYFNKLNMYKYLFGVNNIKLKNNKPTKMVMHTTLDIRYYCFVMLLLCSKYHYKRISASQVTYDIHHMLGQMGLKESVNNINNITSMYQVLQTFKYGKHYTMQDLILYNKLDVKCKKALSLFIDTPNLDEHITKLTSAGMPFSERELNITNEQLMQITNKENISKIRKILFELCLQGVIHNSADMLVQYANIINEKLNNK